MPSLGTNQEVYVLLAVVLAGVYPGARYGNAVGVLFGAFLVAILGNLLNLANVSALFQGFLIGALFLFTLVFTFAINGIMGIVYRGRRGLT
jgi:ribose transport system permease protein